MKHDLRELISALIDDEIKDTSIEKNIREQINQNSRLKIEYDILKLTKETVIKHKSYQPTPVHIRNKILKELQPKPIKTRLRWSGRIKFASQPYLAYGISALLLLIAALLLIVNPFGSGVDFALKQSGNNNMLIMAENNFHNILQGKINAQFNSSDPTKIKDFFFTQGVQYETYVPTFSKWKLLGAVVSENNGEKFAHQIYLCEGGKLIYIFQVDESYLTNRKALILSEDLLNYILKGECFSTKKDDCSMLMTKNNNIIMAVVTNSNFQEVQNEFCQVNTSTP